MSDNPATVRHMTPDYMPVLSAGAHDTPQDGACVPKASVTAVEAMQAADAAFALAVKSSVVLEPITEAG